VELVAGCGLGGPAGICGFQANKLAGAQNSNHAAARRHHRSDEPQVGFIDRPQQAADQFADPDPSSPRSISFLGRLQHVSMNQEHSVLICRNSGKFC